MDCRIYNLRLGDAVGQGRGEPKHVVKVEIPVRPVLSPADTSTEIVQVTFDDGSTMWAKKTTTVHVYDQERI